MFFLTPLTFLFLFFFFSTVLRYLPSFPTRRSSDLTRASAVAARLMDRYYVAVAGIALISPVLDFGTLRFTAGKDRKSTRLNSSHVAISYAVFCLKKKNNKIITLSSRN